jgi:hypothetical protein
VPRGWEMPSGVTGAGPTRSECAPEVAVAGAKDVQCVVGGETGADQQRKDLFQRPQRAMDGDPAGWRSAGALNFIQGFLPVNLSGTSSLVDTKSSYDKTVCTAFPTLMERGPQASHVPVN